jgi:hypothetical protein
MQGIGIWQQPYMSIMQGITTVIHVHNAGHNNNHTYP